MKVQPSAGIWAGYNFEFEFQFPDDWPIAKPKVKALTKLGHPNIDIPPKAGVCVNILRESYVPVFTIKEYVNAILFLFSEPNAYSPLNHEASQEYAADIGAFTKKTREWAEESCRK